MSEHYGEQARAWPGGCKCHGEGVGYYVNYRELFDGWVENVVGDHARLSVFVADRIDDLGGWWWRVGSFSWTPHGELYDDEVTGLAPTRERAIAQAHEAALSAVRLAAEFYTRMRRQDAEREAAR